MIPSSLYVTDPLRQLLPWPSAIAPTMRQRNKIAVCILFPVLVTVLILFNYPYSNRNKTVTNTGNRMQTAILFLCLIVGAIADGHGRSCLSGSVTYNDEGIIFDGTKHMECQEDQTACYQIQMEASLNHSMAGEWTGIKK
jgi:hypothetical protein